MNFRPTRRSVVVGLGLAAPMLNLRAQAQGAEWPSKPITIIVPFSAGGSVDRMGRGLAQFLSPVVGQPVVVENRPGAGGQAGTTFFLTRPDDGHTLMVTPAMPFMGTNILLTGARYKLDDFAFVNAQWVDFALAMVHKDRPYQTLQQLIDAIKANPGKLSAAVTYGSIGQVATMMLLDTIKMPPNAVRIVTYDSGGGVRTALAGNQVDFAIDQAEGSETIIDFVRPLALFRDSPHPAWKAPLINDALKPLGVSVPILSGSIRTLVAPASFRDKHPQGWEKLIATYRKALDNPDYQSWLRSNQIGGDWVGPEKTRELIDTAFKVLSNYKHLLKA
jgi:tripartite-type tricarboxylate transporter receptor subunit TctC